MDVNRKIPASADNVHIVFTLLTEVSSLHIMKVSYLKWLPLTTSTDSRPVVPLYARPRSSSGTPPCCMECVEPVLSLRARLNRSEADEFSYNMAQTQHLCSVRANQLNGQVIHLVLLNIWIYTEPSLASYYWQYHSFLQVSTFLVSFPW